MFISSRQYFFESRSVSLLSLLIGRRGDGGRGRSQQFLLVSLQVTLFHMCLCSGSLFLSSCFCVCILSVCVCLGITYSMLVRFSILDPYSPLCPPVVSYCLCGIYLWLCQFLCVCGSVIIFLDTLLTYIFLIPPHKDFS